MTLSFLIDLTQRPKIYLIYDPFQEFPAIYLKHPLWSDLSLQMVVSMNGSLQLLFHLQLVTVMAGKYIVAGPAMEVLRIWKIDPM